MISGTSLHLDRIDPGGAGLLPAGGKAVGRELVAADVVRLQELQQLLWADARHAVLVVLQGLDTAGKDGAIRHVLGPLNPQGVAVHSFKVPTPQERAHDFLWRVHAVVPGRGWIGVFNRSHYEDLIVPRVLGGLSSEALDARVTHVNAFERYLADEGVTIRKFFLHISREEQRERLQARLDDPAKNWKLEPADLETRRRWDDYLAAYERVIARTSTDHAPWYVVPADHKWYRDVVVARVLRETLAGLDLAYPPPHPDLAGLRIED